MDRRIASAATLLAVMSALSFVTVQARDLSFEQRVAVQETIDRFYYADQAGAQIPFEEAVPRAVLETKVRRYLRQSAMLEQRSGLSITWEMLRAELERIAATTRHPQRLRALYSALDDDSFVVHECFARPLLVDRLARGYFRSTKAEPALSWDAWWASTEGAFDETRVRAVTPEAIEMAIPAAEQSGQTCSPADAWEPISDTFAPDSANGVWTGTHLITRTERYDPLTDTWTATSTVGAPTALGGTSVWTGTEMIYWGGYVVTPEAWYPVDTGARYNPLTDTWVATPAGPSARGAHTAVWTGTEMIVWGGNGVPVTSFPLGGNSSGSRYNPTSDTWTPTSTVDVPPGRYSHTAVWTGTEMIVWGGRKDYCCESPSFWAEGGRYSPATDTWAATSTTNIPSVRYSHAATWTGTEMFISGGVHPFAGGLAGRRYDPATDTWTALPVGDPEGGHVFWLPPYVVFHSSVAGPGDSLLLDPVLDVWTPMNLTGAPQVGSIVPTGEGFFFKIGSEGRAVYSVGDTDNDGLCADQDNCIIVSNPGQSDLDADTVGDVCDNCPNVSNADQIDADGDTAGDVCDLCPFDPLDDVDGDAVCGDADNCPATANAGQADADADAVGDVCDNCPVAANPTQTNADGDTFGDVCDICPLDPLDDVDGDFLCGDVDNCPATPNTGQDDADADGKGDVCDPCPLSPLDDSDGDGLCDHIDNCPALANSGQGDGDGDRWASGAVASSEWSATDYAATQATGPPESAGLCADVPTNWSPLTDADIPEFVELTYPPVEAVGVSIHESFESGFVIQVDLRDADGNLHTVWSGTDMTACGETLDLSWPVTTYEVAAVVVRTKMSGWEEIDAVELHGASGDGIGSVCDVCPSEFDPSQADGDGDGSGDACDCAPADSSARPSADVSVTMERTLNGLDHSVVWETAAGAQSYNVFRASLDAARTGGFGSCPLTGSAETMWVDPDTPVPGEAFVYWVQGVSPVCGPGSLGFDSEGSDRGIQTCP